MICRLGASGGNGDRIMALMAACEVSEWGFEGIWVIRELSTLR